jgi:ankyrin repeat protein
MRRTRLMAAARAGDVPRLIRLLRTASGALRGRTNVNGAGYEGSTALQWAAREGHVAAIEVLLGAGAAIKLPGRSSALHDAGMAGQVSSINILVAAGGEVDAKDENGATPLHLALRYGMDEAAVALLAAGADVNAWTTTAWPPCTQ